MRAACGLAAALASGILVFLALPGRPADPSALRHQYVRCLLSSRGTLYVWGGGDRLGIDCSGLVQRALIDADLAQAAETLNPRLARAGLSLWWHSRSARALGDGSVEPGDLAVLSDGVHVLAYVGDRTWIEADPAPMRVILARAPRARDYYFNASVRLMRWRALEHG